MFLVGDGASNQPITKTFSEKEKLKKLTALIRPALKELLKELL